MEQKRKTRPQERRSRKFEKEAPRHKRPQAETEPKRREEPRELPDDVLVGRNAVTEALKSGRGINKLWIASGDREGSVAEIAALAKERGKKTVVLVSHRPSTMRIADQVYSVESGRMS